LHSWRNSFSTCYLLCANTFYGDSDYLTCPLCRPRPVGEHRSVQIVLLSSPEISAVMSHLANLAAERIRVLVAEPTSMSSQLIAGALKRRANFDVHAFSGDSSGTFRELQKYQPHVSLISAELQDGPFTGFKVLHQLRTVEPKPATVMMLDSDERDLVVDAFRAGARGVFCRGYPFKALPKCIRRVHEGQIWVSNSELEVLLDLIGNMRPAQIRTAGGMARLTPREQDVARFVAEGMRNQEIAVKLNLREHTVRNYMLRIFDKLGVSSRIELVLYALSEPESERAR
jgi:two-component system nitrate/nitrite response regulator NarL